MQLSNNSYIRLVIILSEVTLSRLIINLTQKQDIAKKINRFIV